MSQLMAMRIAEQHVQEFDSESEVMRDHHEAMDCLEKALQLYPGKTEAASMQLATCNEQ